MRIIEALAGLILVSASVAYPSSGLLYLEAQGIAGYSEMEKNVVYYSMTEMDVMQKPGIGFDYLKRLSSETVDWGIFALQARAVYDTRRRYDLEPQLYNAFFKIKAGFGDFWLGHNKPAFGLSSTLDNHGTLLQPLSMHGYGYDRDWGAGFYRDYSWGSLGFSGTAGAGMPLRFKGNYLLSGRLSKGDLSQQNYNFGLSASYGKNLQSMGYHLTDRGPMPTAMAGADASIFQDRWENRIEFIWSREATNFPTGPFIYDYVIFHRLTVNLLDENRLKLEVQNRWKLNDLGHGGLTLAAGYQVTSDITFRSMAEIEENNTRLIAQLYWYHKM